MFSQTYLRSLGNIWFIKRGIIPSSLISNVAIFRRKTKLLHNTTKLLKDEPDDRLIIDPDSDVSPRQCQIARAYMKVNKLNQNKWEKPKSLFAKRSNVDYSKRNSEDLLLFSNNEKDNLLGTKCDKSNNLSQSETSNGMPKRNWSRYKSKNLGDKPFINNLSRTDHFNNGPEDFRERSQKSEAFNAGFRNNMSGSTDPRIMENSSGLQYFSKNIDKYPFGKKRMRPPIVRHQKEIDHKLESKVDFVSALTELKAIQEINVENDDHSSALRTRQKFASKKDKVLEKPEHRKPKSLKKGRELWDEEDGYFDVNYEVDGPKKKSQVQEIEPKLQREVFIPEAISIANLAKMIGVRLATFEQKLQNLGIEYVSHDHLLNAEEASLIAMEYDLNPVVNSEAAIDLYPKPKPADMSKFPLRPPIVAILGHVDHGKTTLLDTLRKSSIAAGEAGGITQHIGAFSVSLPSEKTITFLDTPGHAAFSAMRARGAFVTDIVVLVVAADDGVMPQTLEAIKHAKDAGVPMVVAINKIDRHNANPQKVREALLSNGVELEEYDGETQSVEVSALTGQGLDRLEEAIITLSELSEFRAEVDIETEGAIIESQVEKGKGNVATVLVKRGTLKQGDIIVAGTTWCRVRVMTDEKGQIIKNALPGTPIKVTGWKELPVAGDEVLQAKDEELAKTVVANRALNRSRDQQLKDLEVINEKRRQRKQELETERANARNFKKEVWMFHQGLLKEYPTAVPLQPSIKEEKPLVDTNKKGLNVVVKADVSGTAEAVVDALYGLGNNEVCVKIIDFGVGDVTESDIQMANVAKAIILGFNVKACKKVQSQARIDNVDMKFYKVIYHLLDEVKEQLGKLLPPILETHVTGEAKVLQIFQINVKSKEFKPVAGCRITNGTVFKNQKVRILRDNNQIWEGSLETLKQMKKEVNEIKKGLECGMSFEGFNGFKEGDSIQSIVVKEVPRSL
ncbi:2569_t:CDS:10 [Funneliformis caledonium]|uniref:Translation initiation factor IF-2, mitochondrial n=1 Tax=Funneliformis caledonium TaxID=1117310 RepID=A0A9N8VCD3_9GLOM|nr:2569_t:CDS:10 [Funneliformis caledonium]